MVKFNIFSRQINPSNIYRHNLLIKNLSQYNRATDYDNIIKLLSPPVDISTISLPEETKKIKIGIIGGGLSGMAAAFELRKVRF